MQSRRDVGNEVIVALAVIGMLALALTFGVVLTLTRTVPPEGTGTVSAAATSAVTTQAATVQATVTTPATTLPTTVAPTTAPTTEPTRATTTQAATAVAQVKPATATATIAPTLQPTLPPTPIVYPTRKPRTPVPTVTIAPTNIPTATSIPPTYPLRKTDTPAVPPPTYPPRRTRPASTVAPTIVPTQAVTTGATRIVDAGILPTLTPTITPTVLITTTGTALPTIAIQTSCTPRTDWVRYTVQPGDTLFNIAVQSRITLAQLQQANCISNPNTIFYGRVIVIPPGVTIATIIPTTPTVTGTAPASGTGNAALCPNADLRITSPLSGSEFKGILSIFGTARAANFANYQLEFQPDGTSEWVRTGFSSVPVTDGVLGRLDPNPSQLPAGGMSLRLRIEVTSGSAPAPCVIKVKLVR